MVNAASFSPDGSRIITGSSDKTARVWDAASGVQLKVLSGHAERVFGVALFPRRNPHRHRLARSNGEDLGRQPSAQLAVLSGHDSYVNSAAYSPDGSRIVTASRDKTLRIWDARTGALLPIQAKPGGYLYCAAYSPDGTRIVTASDDGSARLWDAALGRQLASLGGHAGYVFSAAFSPDGNRVVTGSADKTARVWDAYTGRPLATLAGHSDKIYSVVYSPDGRRVLTASGDRTARIWDARSGRTLAVLAGHEGTVLSAAYSPDATRIVTASDDGTARIWGARTGEQLAVLAGHEDSVNSAVYSPDGARILTASSDKTARIWEARIQASVPEQILWAIAAQIDPLPEADRAQLGLPPNQYGTAGAPVGASRTARAPDQKGTRAGEPAALARLAEREEYRALAAHDVEERDAQLLHALGLYAAAAERADEEAWPDDAWLAWRHRRATLARVLGREGMVRAVAKVYGSVHSPGGTYRASTPTRLP